MDRLNFSAKHLAIDKANTQIVIAVAAAAFITIFCLVASKAVLNQYNYQSRVMSAARTADNNLKTNMTTYNNLVQSYTKFNSANPNVLGSPVTGNSNDNTQIILDALPGAYDFPGLATTVQNMLTSNANGMQIGGVSGTDNQLTQTSNPSSTNPQPVIIPFSFSVSNASFSAAQNLIQYFQKSIRPMPIDSLTLSGSQGALTMSVEAHTYFQPAKSLNITKETIN